MNKDNRLVYTKDGNTCVLTPTPEMFDSKSRTRQCLEFELSSDEEVWNFIIAREKEVGNINDTTVYSMIHKDDLPADRTFRNAWVFNHKTKTCSHDMSKACEIHKNHLRELRKPKLEALDVAFMRAQEEGNSSRAAEIISEKQILRDVTKFSTPATVEELKNYVPDCLK